MGQLLYVFDSILSVFNLLSLLLLVLGTFLGIIVGAIPGLTPVVAMACMIPITYTMSAEVAIVLFLGIYVGSQYGNSIPAIVLGLPGTPSAAITALEGYPLQKAGQGERALGVALLTSVFGQAFGGIAVAFFLIPFANIAIYFLFPEVFALAVLGLMATAGLSEGKPIKGIISAAFGVSLATIGTDPIGATPRFAFGNLYLTSGLNLVSITIGFLIVGELLYRYTTVEEEIKHSIVKIEGSFLSSWSDFITTFRVSCISSIIGFITGVLPGAGGTVGAILAYQQSKSLARHPELYGGKGSIEAIAAADAANNANTAGTVIPTLGLGIPGSPSMVLVLMVLLIHGVSPGPALSSSAPESVMATIGALILAPIALFAVGFFAIKPSLFVASLPQETLRISALVIALAGVYSLQWSMFDIYVAIVLGFISFLMRHYGFPILPAVMGAILGGTIETNLRRGLSMTYGSFIEFFTRIPVMVILSIGIVTLVYSFLASRKTRV